MIDKHGYRKKYIVYNKYIDLLNNINKLKDIQ